MRVVKYDKLVFLGGRTSHITLYNTHASLIQSSLMSNLAVLLTVNLFYLFSVTKQREHLQMFSLPNITLIAPCRVQHICLCWQWNLKFSYIFTTIFHTLLLAFPCEQNRHDPTMCPEYSTCACSFACTCFHGGCSVAKYRRIRQTSWNFAKMNLPEMVKHDVELRQALTWSGFMRGDSSHLKVLSMLKLEAVFMM